MSVESAQAMLDKIKSDPEFGKKIEDAPDNETRKSILHAAGFDDVSRDDMKKILHPERELDDDDLEKVAGGASASWVGSAAGGGGAAAAAGAI